MCHAGGYPHGDSRPADAEFKAAVIAKIPMSWFGRPEEVAHLGNSQASE